jgi:NADPH:quinone reductase-like Zn-dependent oxidoreductase
VKHPESLSFVEAASVWMMFLTAYGALKPIIDRTFKFDEMVEVHRYLENSRQFGKIVVTL